MAQARITTIIDRYENKFKAAKPSQMRGLINDLLGDINTEHVVAKLIASKAENDYLSGKD